MVDENYEPHPHYAGCQCGLPGVDANVLQLELEAMLECSRRCFVPIAPFHRNKNYTPLDINAPSTEHRDTVHHLMMSDLRVQRRLFSCDTHTSDIPSASDNRRPRMGKAQRLLMSFSCGNRTRLTDAFSHFSCSS